MSCKVINIENKQIKKLMEKRDKEANNAIETIAKDPNSITYKGKKSDKQFKNSSVHENITNNSRRIKMDNKIQIAINHLKVGNFHQPHIDMAIEALEKQIPKRVPIEYDDEFTCPTCGKTTEDYDVTTLKVCPECGQKLRWE